MKLSLGEWETNILHKVNISLPLPKLSIVLRLAFDLASPLSFLRRQESRPSLSLSKAKPCDGLWRVCDIYFSRDIE